MLIYRSTSEPRAPREWLTMLGRQLRQKDASLESCRDLCIELGRLESAVVDVMCVDVDRVSALSRLLRRASSCAAGRFVATFEHDPKAAADWQWRTQAALSRVSGFSLPDRVEATTPEGFAYYGLYPEQYVRSSLLALQSCDVSRAVVIGLRSIGTTLASVVEATLLRRGCHVASYVVRPRGPPWARELQCDRALLAELAAHAGAHYFVVDEGPGQSGSSLTCVARALRELGVAATRIVFLPSHGCDGAHFVNPAARATWTEHAHFAADFEPAWLEGVVPGAQLCDLSAGAWRAWLGAGASAATCFPQHERRKFVAKVAGQDTLLLRFAGFGEHGERVLARAQALQRSGVTPRVYKLQHGMLVLQYLRGRPLNAGEVSSELLRTVAGYLAFRRDELRAAESAPLAPLAEMARHNIVQALGGAACRPLSGLVARASSVPERATVVDGRLMPQEWLVTDQGLKKLDAFDHGDDHFYPGPCDIAWDVAGASAELGLSTANTRGLAALYARAANDVSLQLRLPFFEVAYLAYRVGYVSSVRQALLSAAPVEERASSLDRYVSRLATRLAEHAR